MRSAALCVLLAVLAGPVAPLWAQSGGATAASEDTTATEADADWLLLPYASYAPETKLAGGLVLGYYPPTPAGTRPSSLQAVATYTQRNQIILQVRPEWYFGGDRWRLDGEAMASKYPDSFYGIGGDTPEAYEEPYTSRFGLVDLSLQRILRAALYVGPRIYVRTETDPDVDDACTEPSARSQTLACNLVPGADGGVTAGVGVRATWDRRNSLYAPTDGVFADAAVMGHSAVIGSDFTFGRGMLDLRGYRSAGPGTLAGNVYLEAVVGTAPFQVQPLLGGASRMRGFREGRFRDDVYWATQLAYRVPLFWRLGMAVFASAGEVAGRIGGDLVRDVEVAGGLGGRLRLTEGGVHGRLDIAYSASGLQLYISLGEAF